MNRKRKIQKKLIISRLLAPTISSRDVINILEKAIKKIDNNSSVILDFSDVKFISRSAAHALLLMREKLQPRRDISFANTNEDVSNMLRIVAANRVVSKNQKPKFKPKKTNIKSLFESLA